MDKNRIIVFVKNAKQGKVKTRLAKTVGDEKALEVYLQLLKITKNEVSKVSAQKEVWYAWELPEKDIWDEKLFNKRIQIEGDLGEKMKDAFKRSFEEECEKVIVIGSDCPTLSSEIIEEAFEKLSTSDSVFGPSEDGGYYLIGMSSYLPQLLENISWSTEEVLRQTEEQATKNNISLSKLETLNDIDYEEDWNEYLENKK